MATDLMQQAVTANVTERAAANAKAGGEGPMRWVVKTPAFARVDDTTALCDIAERRNEGVKDPFRV